MCVFDEWDDYLFEGAVRIMWQEYGLTYFPIVAITFAMAMAPGLTFEEVLEIWCDEGCELFDWPRDEPQRVRALICAKLLARQHDYPDGIEKWFDQRAEEVRKYADRVSIATRG